MVYTLILLAVIQGSSSTVPAFVGKFPNKQQCEEAAKSVTVIKSPHIETHWSAICIKSSQ